MPKFIIEPDVTIRIDFLFCYPFYHANGKPRVFDSANLIKLAQDSIAERYGFNDYRVRCGSWDSLDDENERVEIVLSQL